MVSLTRRANSRWRPRYRDAAGKEHARHFEKKADAQAWLGSVTTSVLNGAYVDPKRMRVTLADRAGVWLDSKLDLKPSTWRCCETSLRVHFLPVWAEPPRVQWNRDSAGLSPVTPAIEGEQASSRTRPARCRRRALCRRQ
jgi:hypothetical protein